MNATRWRSLRFMNKLLPTLAAVALLASGSSATAGVHSEPTLQGVHLTELRPACKNSETLIRVRATNNTGRQQLLDWYAREYASGQVTQWFADVWLIPKRSSATFRMPIQPGHKLRYTISDSDGGSRPVGIVLAAGNRAALECGNPLD